MALNTPLGLDLAVSLLFPDIPVVAVVGPMAGALVASGPMMTCFEVPNSAYITIAPSATYNPATGVTPARSP